MGRVGTTARPAKRRAAVVAVSAAAMGLGTTPAFLLGYLGPELLVDLDLSRAALGLLIGIFYGCTGLSSALAARLVEPWGARRCIVLDLVVVSACLLGVAVVRSPVMLAVATALAGAGYALTNAGTSMAVAAVAPLQRSGQDLTVKTAGVPIMATLLAVAGPPVGDLLGWPAVFVGLALLALVGAGAAALALPGRRALRGPHAGQQPDRPPRLSRWFVLLPVAAFLFIGGSQPLLSWLVLALTDAGLQPSEAGWISASGTGVGVVAMLLISRAAEAGFTSVVVACEPTGHRWRVLDQIAAEHGVRLVCVQPLLVHRAREAETSPATRTTTPTR